MASLTRTREKEHGFPVFVLQTPKPLTVDHRDIVFGLPCWMGIELHPDAIAHFFCKSLLLNWLSASDISA
jgi:hypothetical protein